MTDQATAELKVLNENCRMQKKTVTKLKGQPPKWRRMELLAVLNGLKLREKSQEGAVKSTATAVQMTDIHIVVVAEKTTLDNWWGMRDGLETAGHVLAACVGIVAVFLAGFVPIALLVLTILFSRTRWKNLRRDCSEQY